jgi:hypothetical protein
MSTSTTQPRTETVAHAFADLMNGHDPNAVDKFVAEVWAISLFPQVLPK